MKFSLIISSAFASTIYAQTTTYTDPRTSITYQAFQDPAGYTFGIAVPTTPSTDFIGLLVGNVNGWAGASLGGQMVGKLLISAWPNGQKVNYAFRKASAYASPPAVTGGFSITPIANGTYVNGTKFALTFICKGCIKTDGTTFSASDTQANLGWALSSTPPASPASNTTRLQYHNDFGQYGLDLVAARSADYSRWTGAVAKREIIEPSQKLTSAKLGRRAF